MPGAVQRKKLQADKHTHLLAFLPAARANSSLSITQKNHPQNTNWYNRCTVPITTWTNKRST